MSIFDGKLTIEAAAASGIEAVTKRELTDLGYTVSGAEYGRIRFEGDFSDVIRANVFLRTANRVRIVLSEFDALTFDELFEKTAATDWQEILPRDAKIVVDAKSVKSNLFALSSIQSIVKRAIISRLSAFYGINRFPESGAAYSFEASVRDNKVTITLDTSGDGLHKRGYRTYLGDAPIRETLAAAIIKLSVWNPERALIDPFCGSGTIPVEAALIAQNAAPGMRRSFCAEYFTNAPDVRTRCQEEAEQLLIRDVKTKIQGYDLNPDAVKLALLHAKRADVSDCIHIQTRDVKDLSSRFSCGVIIANPPYGERLMSGNELTDLYRTFGQAFDRLDGWSAYVITSFRGFEKHFGKRADKTRRLYNSELECTLYRYLGRRPEPVRTIDGNRIPPPVDVN